MTVSLRSHTQPAMDPPGRDALIGRVVHDRYRVVGRLGAGGMGIVYRGIHEVLGTSLAMKVLHPHIVGDEEAVERFRREARAASAIGNEHIVEVRDFGELEDGSTYIVMELIEGQDLLSLVSEGPLTLARTRDVALQLCEALQAAHERGIVHRDLKLENVILTERRDRPDFVKLVDFGIAKVQGSAKLTAAGRVMGTPEYMSPEQCGAHAVDHRADIYALGVMLYEMVTGTLPFTHPELGALFRMHIHEPPVAPSARRPDLVIPLGLDAVILRCLAKSPAARFQRMSEVAEALRAIEGVQTPFVDTSALEPSVSTPVTAPTEAEAEVEPGPGRPRARTRRTVAGLALLALGTSAVAWRVAEPGEEAVPAPTLAAPRPEPSVLPDPPAPAPTSTPPGESAPAGAPSSPTPSPAITIHTEPERVRVLDAEGVELGETPLRLPRPAAGQRVALELRREGYEPHPVLLSDRTAAELTIPLARRERRRPGGPPSAEPGVMPTPPRAPSSAPPTRREMLDPWGQPERAEPGTLPR